MDNEHIIRVWTLLKLAGEFGTGKFPGDWTFLKFLEDVGYP